MFPFCTRVIGMINSPISSPNGLTLFLMTVKLKVEREERKIFTASFVRVVPFNDLSAVRIDNMFLIGYLQELH